MTMREVSRPDINAALMPQVSRIISGHPPSYLHSKCPPPVGNRRSTRQGLLRYTSTDPTMGNYHPLTAVTPQSLNSALERIEQPESPDGQP